MARSRKSKKKRGSSGIGVFVLGILVGVIGTALTYGVLEDRPSDIGAGIDSLIDMAANRSDTTQADSDSDGGITDSLPNINFNFHEILLEDEYVLPRPRREKNPQKATVASKPEKKQPEPRPSNQQTHDSGSKYVLQVGSFKLFEQADALKVNLALYGQQAFIQKVTVEGRGEYFRVRLGPFDQASAAQKVSDSIARLGFQAIRFRYKG